MLRPNDSELPQQDPVPVVETSDHHRSPRSLPSALKRAANTEAAPACRPRSPGLHPPQQFRNRYRRQGFPSTSETSPPPQIPRDRSPAPRRLPAQSQARSATCAPAQRTAAAPSADKIREAAPLATLHVFDFSVAQSHDD